MPRPKKPVVNVAPKSGGTIHVIDNPVVFDAEMTLQSELAALDQQYGETLQKARENYKRTRREIIERYEGKE